MAQRRHHYEQAFEQYLRHERIPYVAVNEAKKSLVPASALEAESLKSFDFVVYGAGLNLLCEVKGRRAGGTRRAKTGSGTLGRLESWVHADDVASMQRWQTLFGHDFKAVFVFLYWCDAIPADGLFEEIMEHRERWYALRAVSVDEYARSMRVRSAKWNTRDIPASTFHQISRPFCPPRPAAPASWSVGVRTPVLEPIGF